MFTGKITYSTIIKIVVGNNGIMLMILSINIEFEAGGNCQSCQNEICKSMFHYRREPVFFHHDPCWQIDRSHFFHETQTRNHFDSLYTVTRPVDMNATYYMLTNKRFFLDYCMLTLSHILHYEPFPFFIVIIVIIIIILLVFDHNVTWYEALSAFQEATNLRIISAWMSIQLTLPCLNESVLTKTKFFSLWIHVKIQINSNYSSVSLALFRMPLVHW